MLATDRGSIGGGRHCENCYLSLRALAGYSGLSVRTLRSRLVDGTHPLPHYRVGGKILVRRSDFDRWVEQFRATQRTVSVGELVDDVMASLG